MIICPSCSAELPGSLACNYCSWQAKYRAGLPVFLKDSDLDDPVTRSYLENYDEIAKDDLDGKVMDERYIENLSTNLCNIIDLPPEAEVCDIGSGKGFLVRKLKARGAGNVTAVDISLPYLARMVGEPGISPVLANAESLPFLDHFDVVVATDVLEHVLNVGSLLYSANRALRTNGRLYIRVPYKENLLPYSPHFGCPSRFVHLRTYDRPLLRQALTEAGFAVERVWYDGYVPELRRALWRGGRLRRMTYAGFEWWLNSTGRDFNSATLRPHGLSPIFLRPTVVVAAARKVGRLVPLAGRGFQLEAA